MLSEYEEDLHRAYARAAAAPKSALTDTIRRSLESLMQEDSGWLAVYGGRYCFDPTMALANVRRASQVAHKLARTPLVIRGKKLRNSYMLGSGVTLTIDSKSSLVRSRIRSLIPVEMLACLNDALVDDGNAFLRYDFTTRSCRLVPLANVQGIETDPNDGSFIRYVKTQRVNDDGTIESVYVPTHEWLLRTGGDVPSSLDEGSGLVAVDRTAAMHVMTTPRDAGQPLGIPMTNAAALWIMAYMEFLTGSMDLFKSLVSIAWKIQVQNRTAGQTMVAKVQGMDSHGGAAISSADTTLTGLGVPSSQVNFNSARPVAGMVSAVFGVPLAGLLTDVGTSGTNNSLSTLDTPMLKGFELDRTELAEFMDGIYSTYSNVDVGVSFPIIVASSEVLQFAQLLAAGKWGAFGREEIRTWAAKTIGVDIESGRPPAVKDFNQYLQNPWGGSDGSDSTPATAGLVAGAEQAGVGKQSAV